MYVWNRGAKSLYIFGNLDGECDIRQTRKTMGEPPVDEQNTLDDGPVQAPPPQYIPKVSTQVKCCKRPADRPWCEDSPRLLSPLSPLCLSVLSQEAPSHPLAWIGLLPDVMTLV